MRTSIIHDLIFSSTPRYVKPSRYVNGVMLVIGYRVSGTGGRLIVLIELTPNLCLRAVLALRVSHDVPGCERQQNDECALDAGRYRDPEAVGEAPDNKGCHGGCDR